jgi:hypothetical protein
MANLSIETPNTDRSLLTLGERRAAAGANDGARDSELTALGNYVDAMITKACQIARAGAIPPTLRLESVRETFRLKSTQTCLIVARFPVVEFGDVVENGVTLSDADFEIDGRCMYRLSNAVRICWPCGEIVISYSAGYEVVPPDLKYAAIKFMQGELSRGGRDPLLRSVSIPDVISKDYWVDPGKDTVVPADVMTLLDDGGYINKWGWMV